MPKYYIPFRARSLIEYEVWADSPEEAESLARSGMGTFLSEEWVELQDALHVDEVESDEEDK